MTECPLCKGLIIGSGIDAPYIMVEGLKICTFCFRALATAGLLYEGPDDEWHTILKNSKDLLLF